MAASSSRSRSTQPSGANGELVADVLCRCLPRGSVEAVRSSGQLFSYKLEGTSGRKTDSEALYKNKDVLAGLIESNAGSTVLDKSILKSGIEIWSSRVSCEVADADRNSYSLKLMLMALQRAKNNCTTGTRLVGWMKILLAKINSCCTVLSSTTEWEEDGTAPKSRRHIADSPDAAKEKKKRLLVRMPTTPSPQHVRRGRASSCLALEDVDSEEEQDEKEQEEQSHHQGIDKEIGTGYMYYWDEGVGGLRISKTASAASEPEPCSAHVKGKSGFIICMWNDGESWHTEQPNSEINHIAEKPNICKRPAAAAVLKKPSGVVANESDRDADEEDNDDEKAEAETSQRFKTAKKARIGSQADHKARKKALSEGKADDVAKMLGRKAATAAKKAFDAGK